MKKIISVLTFGGMLVVASCGSSGEEAPNATIPLSEEEEVTIADKSDVQANMVADIGISGMVCEMSCVSSVRNELMSMPGVKSMEMDFDEEAEVNHAIVEFDDRVTNKDKMIAAIEALNENAYKVESFDEKTLGQNSSSGEVKESAATGRVVERAPTASIEMPSILDLFKGLL